MLEQGENFLQERLPGNDSCAIISASLSLGGRMSRKGPYGRPYQMSKTTEQRFWEKIDRRGEDECWLWKASIRHGYGAFGVRQGYVEIAHRYSWILANGEIPDGLCVLHKCDVPRCVNPKHLFLGTRIDNAADRHAKGRSIAGKPRLGTQNKASKLNEDKVREIRRLHSEGVSIHKLSRNFKVSRPSIKALLTRRTWAWLD